MPKVSILIANYNCGAWVKHAIKSVIAQTSRDWEILILDDKSTDNSLSIIKKMCNGRQIKLIERSERLHCGGSYKALCEEASGEFCGVLDADDALDKRAIESVVKIYEKYHADFVWTQFWLCDKNLRILKKGFSTAPPVGKSLLDVRHAFSHWRTFRTSMREKCQLFNPQLRAAVDKWMGYALEEVGSGVFYNEPLYYYRQRVGGLSFKGRKIWEKMKVDFYLRRQQNKISSLPIRSVSCTK